MDWEKYGDYNDLYNHLLKCADLLTAFTHINKKYSLSESLSYKASQIAFEDKTFYHALLNSGESKALDSKHQFIKISDVFNDALSILLKMTQTDYDACLEKHEKRLEIEKSKPAFYATFREFLLVEKVEREGLTKIEEFPKTIDEFNQQTVSKLIEKGIKVDLGEITSEKTLIQSAKSYISARVETVNMAWNFTAGCLNKSNVER